MANYDTSLLDGDGHTVTTSHPKCADDREALSLAQRMVGSRGQADVWAGARRVGRMSGRPVPTSRFLASPGRPSRPSGPSRVSWAGSDALVWDVERLRIATDAAGVALWSWNVDTDEIAMDERAHGIWGVPRCERQITFEDLSARIHPPDLNRVRSAFQDTRRVMGAYEIDFRILHSNAVRWASARSRGGDEGIVVRVMFGVFLDVTERRQAEEAREMLAGEMSHRVKNLFAIASSLTTLAARSAASTTEMASDLTQRLAALGRAHDLRVRPQTPSLIAEFSGH